MLKYPVPAVTDRVVYISLGRTEENYANIQVVLEIVQLKDKGRTDHTSEANNGGAAIQG